MKEKKYKHMTMDDRVEIQECLDKGMFFKDIAKRIEKDQTTVSKEVKKHIYTYTNAFTTTDQICPRHLFTFTYSDALASALEISFVDPKNMIRPPLLLK